MADAVSNEATETALRAILQNEGWELSRERGHGETGTDIIAQSSEETIHIEVIGYKRPPGARAMDFYQVFFRTVSRLNLGATKCVMAMPSEFGRGLASRVNQHRVAWVRIARAFPELELWLVNVIDGEIERLSWRDALSRA